MKKQTVYLLGILMILIGILSTLHFMFRLQGVFQNYLSRYGPLFHKGFVVRCIFLDITMFLYIASILFKNLYYVIAGILILCFIEFGRELGLLASFIAIVTEVSLRLMHWAARDPSIITPFSMSGFFLFIVGVSIPLVFIYFLTRRTMVEHLKAKPQEVPSLSKPAS